MLSGLLALLSSDCQIVSEFVSTWYFTAGGQKVQIWHHSFVGGNGMAQSPPALRSVLDPTAYQLAFQLAQSLERTLVSRATKLAANDVDSCGEALVTAKHILSALDHSAFQQACSQIGIVLDDAAKSTRKRSLTA
jgi:hypothetical protein